VDNYEFTLISPEEAPKDVYPYHRVWRSVALVIGAVVGMVILIFLGVLVGILRDVRSRNWGLLLILVPIGVYLVYAVRGEQRSQRPREGLFTVALFSALLANGVGVPLVDSFFRPQEWLSDAGFFNRVLGYTLTFGVTAEVLKYIAIRYTVWPRRFRIRMDGIAYSFAAAMGYATVVNLHLVFGNEATVTANAIRIGINFISQIGFGVVMGFFIAEAALFRRPALFLASGLFVGALLNGLYIAFRAIASGSGFNVQLVSSLVLVVGFAGLMIIAINFLIETAENRDAALQGIKRIR